MVGERWAGGRGRGGVGGGCQRAVSGDRKRRWRIKGRRVRWKHVEGARSFPASLVSPRPIWKHGTAFPALCPALPHSARRTSTPSPTRPPRPPPAPRSTLHALRHVGIHFEPPLRRHRDPRPRLLEHLRVCPCAQRPPQQSTARRAYQCARKLYLRRVPTPQALGPYVWFVSLRARPDSSATPTSGRRPSSVPTTWITS